jgi:hypothetical protein
MKNIILMAIVILAQSLIGCDNLIPAEKFVVADGTVYMACAGSVDVQNTNGVYSVRLTDRDWNDAKTAYTDTEVYLQAKLVTVRPMNNDELSICRTGHFRQAVQNLIDKHSQTPETPKTPCEQWREAHPNDTQPCENR